MNVAVYQELSKIVVVDYIYIKNSEVIINSVVLYSQNFDWFQIVTRRIWELFQIIIIFKYLRDKSLKSSIFSMYFLYFDY